MTCAQETQLIFQNVTRMDYRKARFHGYQYYNQALIQMALGHKAAAVLSLKKAMKETQ